MGERGHLVRFRSCLTIRTDRNGLHLSLFVPFPFAPALFIPWDHITVNHYDGLLTDYLDFGFRETPSIILRLSSSTAHEILASAPSHNEPSTGTDT